MSGPSNLERYYRHIGVIDGGESHCARQCGITPDDEMSMRWNVTPRGATLVTPPESKAEQVQAQPQHYPGR